MEKWMIVITHLYFCTCIMDAKSAGPGVVFLPAVARSTARCGKSITTFSRLRSSAPCRGWFGTPPRCGKPFLWAYRAYVCVQPWLHGSWGQFLPGAQKDPECVYLLGLGLRSRRVGRGGNAVPLQPRPFGPRH